MRPQDEADAAQIAYIIDGIRQIDSAGLLADFRITVAQELRALAQRQADANHGRYDPCARYVADLLHVDRERVEKISVGTRAQVVANEVQTYLAMIEDRRQRDAEKQRDPTVSNYFKQCKEEMHRDWIDAPDAPAKEIASPIVITAARDVPRAVKLAQQRRAAR